MGSLPDSSSYTDRAWRDFCKWFTYAKRLEAENQELKIQKEPDLHNELKEMERLCDSKIKSMSNIANDMRNQRDIWMRRSYEKDATITKQRIVITSASNELSRIIRSIGEPPKEASDA